MASTDELQVLVHEQAEAIQALRDELADVRGRLEAVTHGGPTPDRPIPGGPGPRDGGPAATIDRWAVPGVVTDRRQLLRRAGMVAAGAAAGSAAVVLGTADPAAAAVGTFSGSPAVIATGTGPGNAIAATSTTFVATVDARNGNGTGVLGDSTGATGIGVSGSALGGAGVRGTSSSGYPVVAGADFTTAKAHLLLQGPAAEDPTPDGLPVPTGRTDAHVDGEVALDLNRDLWLCTKAGTPGTWRRLGGASTAGALVLLDVPVRVYDSRPGNPPEVGSKSPLGGGGIRTIDTKVNSSGVPAGATAVLANLTVVNTSASGFLAAFRAGASTPKASSINWFTAGEIVANTTVVACDAAAQISLYVPLNSRTDVFVDVIGYYR
ncbi:MAG: hypothetical protein U0Q07_03770 [Acidimicrobiales bacterium]